MQLEVYTRRILPFSPISSGTLDGWHCVSAGHVTPWQTSSEYFTGNFTQQYSHTQSYSNLAKGKKGKGGSFV